MKANVLRKAMNLLLVTAMAIASFSGIKAEAEEIKLPVPKISVKTVNDGTGVEVTINKTKDADGFLIWVSNYDSDLYGEDYYSQNNKSYDVIALNENGKRKRTVILKSLRAGKRSVKVCSWNEKKYGTKKWSAFSKEEFVTIDEAASGYNDKYDFSKVKKGDVINFGSYEQNNDFTDGKEAIEWIVLKKTKTAIFAVSRYALDCLPYHNSRNSITWEKCSLRKWLNNEFYKSAFNKSEQGMIKTTKVKNFDNAVYNTQGGNSTKDKVFLLSQLEMIDSDYGFDESYYTSDLNRSCVPTAYAFERQKHFDFLSSLFNMNEEYACCWWLRSPGDGDDFAMYVNYNGYVVNDGEPVNSTSAHQSSIVSGTPYYVNGAVRPALWINLKS